jgi:threonylcarbamoyladenosine tRNA methylthiotransferase MtaB
MTGDPVGVRVVTVGCKVNQAESEAFRSSLAAAGCDTTVSEPSVVVVNSCCVTGEAERKVRKAVRRALAGPGDPTVVVTGCLANLDPDGIRSLDGRVVVEPDKQLLTTAVRGELSSADVTGRAGATTGSDAPTPDSRTRVAVKVQDGCDATCAYCVVPRVRGGAWSVPAADIVGLARRLARNGVAEIVLTGVDVGSYRSGGIELAGLARLVDRSGVARWRLTSIEPRHVDGAILTALAECERVCPHLHVPLQSGSDRVLAAMRRGYTATDYERVVGALREAIPGVAVTTDVMVGFPGERDDDFERTMELCERVGFSKLHVFRFSRRPGTAADRMSGEPSPQVKAERARRLGVLGEALRERYMLGRVGGHADVLVERVDGGRAEGTTEDYLKVSMPAGDLRVGVIERVALGPPLAGRMSVAC